MTAPDAPPVTRQGIYDALWDCVGDVLDGLGIMVTDGERTDVSPVFMAQFIEDLSDALASRLCEDDDG